MATPQISAYQDNLNKRAALLATGVRMSKQLQAVSAALGSQVVIPIDRTGILTAVELQVSVDMTVTAALTRSTMGPHNLLRNVSYTDFAGVDRTKCPGPFLHDYASIRQGYPFMNVPDDVENSATGLYNFPTTTGPLKFVVRIPLAYDDFDLTGAVLAQTAVGQHYVTVNLASALVGADAWLYPYTAGNATAGNVTITPIMEYIQPQDLNNLPLLDLTTIYGIEGNYTTSDNLVAGQQKYINYPNMRSVLSAIFAFDNGGTFNSGSDISQIALVANSNVDLFRTNALYVLGKMRNGLRADLQAGVYYMGHRVAPINTTLYGNVQASFTPSSVSANSYVPYAFETKYASGQQLPGIAKG